VQKQALFPNAKAQFYPPMPDSNQIKPNYKQQIRNIQKKRNFICLS